MTKNEIENQEFIHLIKIHPELIPDVVQILTQQEPPHEVPELQT